MAKLPLAWLQLKREASRLAVALAGIAFADILMFMQLGFRDSLYYSNVRFHNSLKGEIVLINSQTSAILSLKRFSQKRLYQTLDLQDVESVHPIYVDYTSWKNPNTGVPRNLLVIGINPQHNILELSGLKQNLDKIQSPNVVLYDRSSRKEYGPIVSEFEQGNDVRAEVRRKLVKVGGLFTLGASFGSDGNLITSDNNFLRIFVNRQPGLIDIGLVKLKPGANPDIVAQQLRSYLD